MASGAKTGALPRIVANAGAGPKVVERPHDRFARVENATYVSERQKTLIDPMQVDDVGLLESFRVGNVGSCIGGIDGK